MMETEAARRTRSTAVLRITDEQAEVLAQTAPEEDMPLSEKILIASAAERSRISEMKQIVDDKEDPDYPKHPNQCSFCVKSFKKPRCVSVFRAYVCFMPACRAYMSFPLSIFS